MKFLEKIKKLPKNLQFSQLKLVLLGCRLQKMSKKRAYVNVWATNTAAPNQWFLFVKKIKFLRRAKKRNLLYFGHICRFFTSNLKILVLLINIPPSIIRKVQQESQEGQKSDNIEHIRTLSQTENALTHIFVQINGSHL